MANFSLLAKIGIDSKALQTGLAKAEGRVGKFKAAVASIGPAIAAIGFTAMARKAIDLGSKISDLSEQLRINAESLQVLMAVAAKAGVAQGTLEKALMAITIRTQEAMDGNKLYADSFDRLGINLAEFAQLPTEKKLEAIAKAYNAAGKSQEAFTDIAAILGTRAGPKMLEVLRRMNDEGLPSLTEQMKKAGQVMDDDVIKKMDEAADTIGIFTNGMTVATAYVLSYVIPAFVIFRETFGHLGDAMVSVSIKLSSFLTFLGSGLLSTLDPAIKAFEAFGLSIKSAGQAASFDFSGAKKSIEEAKKAASSAGKELLNIPKEIKAAYKTADAEMKSVNQLMVIDSKERNKKIKDGFADLFGYTVDESKKAGEDIDANLAGGGGGDGPSASGKILDMEEKIKALKLESIRAQASGDKAAQESLDHRIKISEKTVKLMKDYNLSQEEAIALAEKIGGGDNKEKIEKSILDLKLKALQAQAAGDKSSEESILNQIRYAEKVVSLMNEFNMTQKEAADMAKKLLGGVGSGGGSELEEKRNQLEEHIVALKLEAKEAQESGDRAAEKSALKQIQYAEKIAASLEGSGKSRDRALVKAGKLLDEKGSGTGSDPDSKREDLEKKILEMKLKALNAEANGDELAEKSMLKRIKYAEKTVSLMDKFNMTQREALTLATKLLENEEAEEGSGARSGLTGEDLRKASNIAGEGKAPSNRMEDFARREREAGLNLAGNETMSGREGNPTSLDKEEGNIRFERLGNGGYQQFVDGKKGEKFTEEQMQSGLQKQIDKDPTEALLEKINQTLEGKFVSQ